MCTAPAGVLPGRDKITVMATNGHDIRVYVAVLEHRVEVLRVAVSTLVSLIGTLDAQLLAGSTLSPDEQRESHFDLKAQLEQTETTLNAEWPPTK